MKKLFFMAILIICSLTAQAQNYYWSAGKQISLALDTTQIVVNVQDVSAQEIIQQKSLI